jgi:hypothetical protein
VTSFDVFGEEAGVTDLKNAMRERERSSPGEREEAKMDRSTAGVTGMRLVLRGLSAPGSAGSSANDVVLAALAACAAADAESGYGRCDDETGAVVVVAAAAVVETVAVDVAAAYVAGVMVHVLGVPVELVGVRLELEELLERTEDEGEATIVSFRLVSSRIELNCLSDGDQFSDGCDSATCANGGAAPPSSLTQATVPY